MNHNMSIYIPNVFADTKEEDFKCMFELWNIGKVKYVDIVECSTNQAYVHFDYWYDTIANRELQERLNNDELIKKYYIIPKSSKRIETFSDIQKTTNNDEFIETTFKKPISSLTETEEDYNDDQEYQEDQDYQQDQDYQEDQDEYYEEESNDNKELFTTDFPSQNTAKQNSHTLRSEKFLKKTFFWVFLKNKSKKQVPGERKITIDISEITKYNTKPSIDIPKVVPTISYVHYDYYSHIVKLNENYKETIKGLIYDNTYAYYFPSELYYENLSENYDRFLSSSDPSDQSYHFAMEYKNCLDFTFGMFLQTFNQNVNSILTNEYIITKVSENVEDVSDNLVDNNIILEIEKENYYLYNKLNELKLSFEKTKTEIVCNNLFL